MLSIVAAGALSASAAACGGPTTSSLASTTTPAVVTTTTSGTTAPPPAGSDTWTAVWPTAASTIRYATPQAVATGFAADYLHMGDALVGAFVSGDGRSGEVPVETGTTGPVTTVLVRRLGSGGSWWVIGAVAASITVTGPAWGATITSPVTLEGNSVAFEGTVQAEVRADDNGAPLGQGYLTGGSTAMAAFHGTIGFTRPTATYGAVVLYTTSAKDGSVMEATVLRVRLL
jgi:hypothetical protein